MKRTQHAARSTQHSSRTCASGFTLLEVVVALAIGGLVIVGARQLLTQLAHDTDRITQSAELADREANAERLLRSLFLRLEVGTDDTRRFSGGERAVRFNSWCDVSAGWQERCRVTLALDTLEQQRVLTASLSTGELLVLRRGFDEAVFRYLTDANSGGMWFRSWGEGITAPLAVGIILDRDTLILRIGERG